MRTKNPKYYSVRKRKDCDRWELQINDIKGLGILYGGLYKTKADALEAARDKWGLNVSLESEE
jgi:hypothetical protein